MKLAIAFEKTTGIPASEIPSRIAAGDKVVINTLAEMREHPSIGNDRVEKLLAFVSPVEIPAAEETEGVEEMEETKPASFHGSYAIPRDAPPLSSLIGQETAKGMLEEITRSVLNGGTLPVKGLFGDPGSGKTALIQAWGNDLQARSKGEIVVRFVNCKVSGNVSEPEFIELMQECNNALLGIGPRLILILDEYGTKETGDAGSAYKKFVSMASVIGGNKNGGGILPLYKCDPAPFNPHRLGLMVCTWDTGKVMADVKTRFPQEGDNSMASYMSEEMIEILAMLFKGRMKKENCRFTWTEPALGLIARSLRGNARDAETVAIAVAVKAKAEGGLHLVKKNALAILKAKKLRPYGLRDEDIKVIRALEHGAMTEAKVCAILGDDPKKPLKLNYLLSTFSTRDENDSVVDSGPLVMMTRNARYIKHPFADKIIALLSKGEWI